MWGSRASRAFRHTRRARAAGNLTHQLRLYRRPTQQAWLVTGASTALPLTAVGVTQRLSALSFSSVGASPMTDMTDEDSSTEPSSGSNPSGAVGEQSEEQNEEIQPTRNSTLPSSIRSEISKLMESGQVREGCTRLVENFQNGFHIAPVFIRGIALSLGRAKKVGELDEFVSRINDMGHDKDGAEFVGAVMKAHLLAGEMDKARAIFENRPDDLDVSSHMWRSYAVPWLQHFSELNEVNQCKEFLKKEFPTLDPLGFWRMRLIYDCLIEYGHLDSAVELKTTYEKEVAEAQAGPEEKQAPRLSPMRTLDRFIRHGKSDGAKNAKLMLEKVNWAGHFPNGAAEDHVRRALQLGNGITAALKVVKACHNIGIHISQKPFIEFSCELLQKDRIPTFHYLLHQMEDMGCSGAAWRMFFNSLFKTMDTHTIQHVTMVWKQLERRSMPNHITKVVLAAKENRLRFLHNPNIPYALMSFLGVGASSDWTRSDYGGDHQQQQSMFGGGGGYGSQNQSYDSSWNRPNQQNYNSNFGEPQPFDSQPQSYDSQPQSYDSQPQYDSPPQQYDSQQHYAPQNQPPQQYSGPQNQPEQQYSGPPNQPSQQFSGPPQQQHYSEQPQQYQPQKQPEQSRYDQPQQGSGGSNRNPREW